MSDWRSRVNQRALRWVALLLIGLVVGPEVGFSIEIVAVLDLMGAELFLFAFGGAQLIWFWGRVRSFFERIDPYFFVPTRGQIVLVPGIVAHAVPGLMSMYIGLLLAKSVDVDI